MNYYNEKDKKAAAWLRQLITDGLIAKGEVDERSITEVRPADLVGFRQCHFFAGIAGWPLALKLAGWPDDLPVWTGSCPCQPFSWPLWRNWRTPDANHRGGSYQDPEKVLKRQESGHQVNLEDQAALTMSGWTSPSARDWKDTPGMATTGTNPDGSIRTRLDQLPRQAALAIGEPSISCPAETEKRGALNPEHSRWLMGFPAVWTSCGVTGMQSCLKSRQSSSKRSPKQLKPKDPNRPF